MNSIVPSDIKAICFDMDGVLLDSERGWRIYGSDFWNDCGIKELPPELSEQIYGISMQEEHKILTEAKALTMSYETYVSMYDKYSKIVYESSKLSENLEETLQNLQSKNIKLAIVTSSLRSWVSLFLQKLTTEKYFDLIVSIANTPLLNPKPSPDGYNYAVTQLGLSKSSVAAVEDSNRGIAAAKSAGLFTVASSEFINEDYTQTGYDAVIPYLREIAN